MIVHYFLTLIKTELVSIPPPKLLKSYKEMVDNKIEVLFIDGFSQYKDFKFAPIGSYENILWKNTLTKYPSPFWSLEREEKALSVYVQRLSEGKLVFMVDSFMAPVIHNQMCDNLLNKGYFSKFATIMNFSFINEIRTSYISYDPYEKSTSKGVIFGSRFDGYKYIQTRMRLKKFLETGQAIKSALAIEIIDIFNGLRTAPSKYEAEMIRMCKNGLIISPDIHLVGIRYENIKQFMFYILSLWTISFFLFIYEHFLNQISY